MLDRDGVINRDCPQSVRSVAEFELLPGVAQAISLLNKAHIPIAVITNQAVVGRGDIPLEELDRIHQKMQFLLAEQQAHIDEIYFCTDVTVEPNFRRKPAPGMLKEALKKFRARAKYSPFIGDALRDLQAAVDADCPRILVRTGKGLQTEQQEWPSRLNPVHIFPDLLSAVQALAETLDTLQEPFYTLDQPFVR
jgi:D-glycero-D-manno-heptose 1,7-bisphosphate phosphatase